MQQGVGTSRAVRRRMASRTAGLVVAVALGWAVAPGAASAAPPAPTDEQLGAAQQAADAAAAEVGQVLARAGAAQAAVTSAHASATAARAEHERDLAAHQRAQAAADTAAAAAARAQQQLAAARTDVAAFARSSYMDGSTSPGLQALVTAGGLDQLLERAALLDVVGQSRADVVDRLAVVQQQTDDASAAARTAVTAAAQLADRAAADLASAERVVASVARVWGDIGSPVARATYAIGGAAWASTRPSA